MTDDTRWNVLFTKHKQKKVKSDGILTVRAVTAVVKKVLLSDESGQRLAERFLGKNEVVESGACLEFDGYVVNVDGLVEQEDVSSPASLLPRVNVKKIKFATSGNKSPAPPVRHEESIFGQSSSAKVGTTWNVLYTKHMSKKVKTYHDGILRLDKNTSYQQKVVLCDLEGKEIDAKFLQEEEEIAYGKTLEFQGAFVEVGDSRGESISSLEQGAVEDIPSSNKETNWHPLKPSSRDWAGTEKNQNVAQARENLDVQPKRRNTSQILEGLKRPVDSITTSLSGICKQVDLTESSMVMSRPHLPFEEENSALGATDQIQRLKVGQKNLKQCVELAVDSHFGCRGEEPGIIDNPKHPDASICTHKEQNKAVAKEVGCKPPAELSYGSTKSLLKKSTKPFMSPQINSGCTLKQNGSTIVFQTDAGATPSRQVVIPNQFKSLACYQSIMSSAIIEELNLILHDLATKFSEARNQLSKVSGSRPSCKQHGPAQLKIVKKDGSNKGRLFYNCVSDSCKVFVWAHESDNSFGVTRSEEELEQGFGCYNIDFYSGCEVFRSGNWDASKKSKDELDVKDCRQDVGVSKKTCVLLKLRDVRRTANYSRHDLWVISSSSSFSKTTSDDFVTVAVNQWHGPSTNGIIELEILGQKPPYQKGLYALHYRGVSTEVTMLQTIRLLHPLNMPLLPLLLHCPKQPPEPAVEEATRGEDFPLMSSRVKIRKQLNTTLARFQLNEDQAKVLLTVSKWFTNDASQGAKSRLLKPELCLVHGTFGSGKSYLLVVLIIFITDLLQILNDTTTRILISAATNIAVDRVLKGLLEQGFHEFMRVGSINKIAKTILPYSVHVTTQNDDKDETTGELQQLNKNAVRGRGLKLEEDLKNIKEGKTKERQGNLKSMRVVGVTCHSCTNPVFEGQNFTICLLDECSQIPEPLSLLPLLGCTKLVAVGDPAQLPPTLSHAGAPWDGELKNVAERAPLDEITPGGSNSEHDEGEDGNKSSDLRRALFVRLVATGHEPILLRTQYRCHPRLTALPSSLFYQGKLINGCRDDDRPPLVQGLPPLLFCDTGRNGVEKRDGSASFMNKFEADLVSQIIKSLIVKGIPGLQIGVVVLYKAQASLLEQTLCPGKLVAGDDFGLLNLSTKLHERTSVHAGGSNPNPDSLADVQVSTVDAFQGMEKNIIILSCCRTNGLGFVASPNRLNVALTRARHHLIIIGRGANLQKNNVWKKILCNVRSTPGSYKPALTFMAEITSGDAQSSGIVSGDEQGMKHSDGEAIAEATMKATANQLETGALIDSHLCSEEVDGALAAVNFSVQDFWVGYKFYCFGYYSHCDNYKEQFLASKMGQVICDAYKWEGELWGAKFDETVRLLWSMMEEYLKINHGKDCTNLRALMEEFEDIAELSASENGQLLLQMMEDDEFGTESLYRHAPVHISSTNIFDQFRARLDWVDSHLEDLRKTSGLQEDSEELQNPVSGNVCETGSVKHMTDGFTEGKRNPNDSNWDDGLSKESLADKTTEPTFSLGLKL